MMKYFGWIKNTRKTLLLLTLVGITVLFLQFHLRYNYSILSERFASLKGKSEKPSLLLFIAVLNKITLFDRRDAVRKTWMSLCSRYSRQVVCKFFTDSAEDLSTMDQARVRNESRIHRDMLFMPYKGAYNFSLRLIWIWKWLSANYKFDFFLRIDDDHFLCLDNLVAELPHRPKNSLYWGFIHCRPRIVRVDEGWMILTRDLIEEALSKVNSTLLCHPYGDQAVASWMIESKYNVTYFFDNDRVIHAATAYDNATYINSDICMKYLSLHGSYPATMNKYWQVTQRRSLLRSNSTVDITAIPRYEDKCPHSNKIFDVNRFYPELRFQMKPCKDEPNWATEKEFHSREKYGELEY